MPMCVAEVLGVSPEVIRISESNTASVPRGFGVYASRGTPVIIGAAVNAAMDARKQLLERAAKMLKVKPEDLDTGEGRIFLKAHPDFDSIRADPRYADLVRRIGFPED